MRWRCGLFGASPLELETTLTLISSASLRFTLHRDSGSPPCVVRSPLCAGEWNGSPAQRDTLLASCGVRELDSIVRAVDGRSFSDSRTSNPAFSNPAQKQSDVHSHPTLMCETKGFVRSEHGADPVCSIHQPTISTKQRSEERRTVSDPLPGP